MDMSGTFKQEARAQAPQAEIVYDRFHVVANYYREVMDHVRVAEANRLRADRHARLGQRQPLAAATQSREPEEAQVRLRKLVAANHALMTAYVLKDNLKEL